MARGDELWECEVYKGELRAWYLGKVSYLGSFQGEVGALIRRVPLTLGIFMGQARVSLMAVVVVRENAVGAEVAKVS